MDSITLARKSIGKSFALSDNFKKYYVPDTKVNYTQLKEELRRLINIAKTNLTLDGTRPSVFIFGPTGCGKTEIVKSISEECGAIFHKIEPQKVPIEELQGFPYLHSKEDGSKVVKLASPTILPPSGDKRLWVLFLDEFNKADTESMAAIMNLVLNGEIGGFADFNEKTGKSEKYRLPDHCVIVGAGNMREQNGSTETNQVNNFDIATAERWHRVLYLEYDFPSWLDSFALNPYTVLHNGLTLNFPTRIPNIILNFLVNAYVDTMRPEAPFLEPKPLENEHEVSSTMSPRAWTLLANSMINDFILNYEDPVSAFMGINEQVYVLTRNVNELGLNGKNLAERIIASFKFNYENNITPDQIFHSYSQIQSSMRNVIKGFGMRTYYIVELAEYIKTQGEGTEFVFDNASLKNVANVSTFFNDVGATAEDISAFISTMNAGNTYGKGFSSALSSVNKTYAEAYSYIIHTDFSKI